MMRKGFAILLVLSFSMTGGCGAPHDNVFQGYVEGEYVYLASPRSGRLETLLVERGHSVIQKTRLFELESEYERHVLRQAEQELLAAQAQLSDMQTGRRSEEVAMASAQLNQAKAEADNAEKLQSRYEILIKNGAISQKELDDARAAAKATAARVAELSSQVKVYKLPERKMKVEAQQAAVNAAAARVAQARWELEQKQVHAPVSGLVYDTLFRTGEWVAAGSPVVQILPPGNVNVRFFVPETMINKFILTHRVLVKTDGRAEPFPAVISYVASNAEYTPPIIYSNETRSKLVFMVEARPDTEIAASLHPGQPVSVSLP